MTEPIRQVLRPDGQIRVWPRDGWTLESASVAAELSEVERCPVLVEVDATAAADLRTLTGAGFAQSRREMLFDIPVDQALTKLARARPPTGVRIDTADVVEVAHLQALDEELRDDIPGSPGWRSTLEEFREATFGDPAFDPRTYLVAVDRSAGECLGLARIWMNAGGPRLGMVGTVRSRRRQGLARALLRGVFQAVAATGATTVTTEVDDTNTASLTLLSGLGGTATGAVVELGARAAGITHAAGTFSRGRGRRGPRRTGRSAPGTASRRRSPARSRGTGRSRRGRRRARRRPRA